MSEPAPRKPRRLRIEAVHVHDFLVLKTGVMKLDAEGKTDASREYATLYCRTCGTTAEVLAGDYTAPAPGGAA